MKGDTFVRKNFNQHRSAGREFFRQMCPRSCIQIEKKTVNKNMSHLMYSP